MNVIRGLICLALAGALSPCWAALGENASSVAADSARMKGALRSSSTAAFTVH
ncbi:MAG: hypothetical protein JOZ67_00475, partial [Gammaproteobacteria bacterium]|nr:hypothetical protein [Gammaproteobacteria bacterium]